ncbi:MAG: 4-hydroxy-3-methylbut-2-enyl diphosphate reductase [Brevinematia bacterium]
MEVILSDEIGFCSGVRIALKKLDEVLKTKGKERVYSIGEIIHNEEVIRQYKEKGVDIVDSIEEIEDGIGVVRAHGLPMSIVEGAKAKGYKIVDATCPFVRNISRIIEKEISESSEVYLIGEPEHPEVIASSFDYKEDISIVDFNHFDPDQLDLKVKKCAIVSQTTLEEDRFIEIAGFFIRKCSETHIYNTICPAAKNRQKSAMEVAKKVDLMIVLGGQKSSNTKRLFEVCSKFTRAVHVERITELDKTTLEGVKRVGIAAGTSTPDWIIEEAVQFLKRFR